MKRRIVEYVQEKTGRKSYCIEKRLLFGWFPDYDFYSPYFQTLEDATKAFSEAVFTWKKKIIYQP